MRSKNERREPRAAAFDSVHGLFAGGITSHGGDLMPDGDLNAAVLA